MRNILLIDDAAFSRNLMGRILRAAGYTICGEASDGGEGIEKYKELGPDLVCCDVMMNGMDGLEFLRELRAFDPGANVVMCSSLGDDYHIGKIKAAGGAEFISKPIMASELVGVVEKLIGKPDEEKEVPCKVQMERAAAGAGVATKQLLDFFEIFHIISGSLIDSPVVTKKYLKEKGDGIGIGIRAMLSTKMSTAQADQLMDIFEGLYK